MSFVAGPFSILDFRFEKKRHGGGRGWRKLHVPRLFSFKSKI
jgi:hypothetical protein